jgi:hypothetical protein
VHLGNLSHDYGNGLAVQHKGFVNATAAMAGMAKTFPDATEVVVAGESAGSVPTPLFAGLARDSYPKAKIVALADSSGAYPDLAGLNATIIEGAWGGFKNVPKWPTNADVTPETWSFPGLYVRAGKHSPDIVFARHDYAADKVQAFFTALGGVAANELDKLIARNETEIEAKGQPLFSYLAPGTEHTVLHKPEFYTETVNGTSLLDWVTNLVTHKPIADVH